MLVNRKRKKYPPTPLMLATKNFGSPPHGRRPLAQPVAGELDVARFLGDVNPHEALHHWLQLGSSIICRCSESKISSPISAATHSTGPWNANGSRLMMNRW